MCCSYFLPFYLIDEGQQKSQVTILRNVSINSMSMSMSMSTLFPKGYAPRAFFDVKFNSDFNKHQKVADFQIPVSFEIPDFEILRARMTVF